MIISKLKPIIRPCFQKYSYSTIKNDLYEGFVPVIGLEIHAQLNSKLKLFSKGNNDYNTEPNQYCTPLDLGYPGYLPILNKNCLVQAIKLIKSLNGEIQLNSKFDRKHYFYPDLSQGYQITQKYKPIGKGGYLNLNWLDGLEKDDKVQVNIEQIQLEQDTANCNHLYSSNETLINYNRMGSPLVEIVTMPDIKTAKQAGQFVTKMRALLRSLNISNDNMEEGSLRCDVNVSIHLPNEPFGNRVELKNLGSIRILVQAIESEILRQIQLKKDDQPILMETRGYNPQTKKTHLLRSKESAPDYRYLPEADLPTIRLNPKQIESIQSKLPPSPDEIKLRLINQYQLSLMDCHTLLLEEGLLHWFETLVNEKPRNNANIFGWLNSTLMGVLNQENFKLIDNRINLKQFSELIDLVDNNILTKSNAKLLIIKIIQNEDKRSVKEILNLKDDQLNQPAPTEDFIPLFQQLVQQYPQQVQSIKEGNLGKLNWLLGQLVKNNRQLNPKLIKSELLEFIQNS